jgi:hypothetical protein
MQPDEKEGRPDDFTETAHHEISHGQATSAVQSNGICANPPSGYADAYQFYMRKGTAARAAETAIGQAPPCNVDDTDNGATGAPGF